MKKPRVVSACLVLCFALALSAQAQTITVDVSHPTNHFVPNQTLGAGVDRIAVEAIDKDFLQPTLEKTMASGWQPVTYRQNTELAVEAWHWNPNGRWSDASGKGYFTGSATPTEPIRYSYGYALPRRGFTRNDGTDNVGFSRLTDGDLNSFWKSNPYLTQHFTGESDALHPQWVVLDMAQVQQIDSIRIAWGEPYARRLRGAVLDGRRSHQSRNTRSVADISARCGYGWKGWNRNCALEQHSYASALRADMDDGVIEHLRRRWAGRSAELRRLCNSRTLPRHNHGRRRVPRRSPPHGRSGADGNVLFVGRSLASTVGLGINQASAGWIRSLLHQRRHSRTSRHDAGCDVV